MRPRYLLKTLPLLCTGAMLLACSSPPMRDHASAVITASADENYLNGRNLYLARRYAAAIAAYEAALQVDGKHVNARNGLAIAYAEQRDFAKAIPIWQELTRNATMGSGQGAAFLFGNLGYAHYLNGNYYEALVALEKACLLDPLNYRAWQYLGETLQKLGQDERAQQMLRQARALREHDFREDYMAAGGGSRVAAIEQAVQTAPRPDREWAFVEVVTKSEGIYELRRVAPAALVPKEAAQPAIDKSKNQPRAAAIAKLEISNGNGHQGLARMLSRQLHDPSMKIVRLTNEKGFKVRQTRVEYQAAFRDIAERLAQRFGVNPPVEVGTTGRADVRLVIGHDLPPQRVASLSNAAPAGHANSVAAP